MSFAASGVRLGVCGIRVVLWSLVIPLVAGLTANSAMAELRVGITQAMFVKDSSVIDRWSDYLSKQTGEPVKFVFRRSYNEMQQLLRLGDLHFAWVCGYPYVIGRDAGYLRYVATPDFAGVPYYKIYFIVPAASSARSVEELRDGVVAFSDPDSISFRSLIAGHLSNGKPIVELDRSFRIHFFTYSHIETIRAVAERVADGGSVDGQVWEALSVVSPELTGKTRIIARSGAYGLPPFVASGKAGESQVLRMRKALLMMADDVEGRQILEQLQVTRFRAYPESVYDSVRSNLIGSFPYGGSNRTPTLNHEAASH